MNIKNKLMVLQEINIQKHIKVALMAELWFSGKSGDASIQALWEARVQAVIDAPSCLEK